MPFWWVHSLSYYLKVSRQVVTYHKTAKSYCCWAVAPKGRTEEGVGQVSRNKAAAVDSHNLCVHNCCHFAVRAVTEPAG